MKYSDYVTLEVEIARLMAQRDELQNWRARQIASAVDHLPHDSTLIKTEKLKGLEAEIARLVALLEEAALREHPPKPDTPRHLERRDQD